MSLLKEFSRYFAIITGWPLYKLVYKTRIYYEDEETKENKTQLSAHKPKK